MKRILTLSIAIALSVLFALTTSDSTANAARTRRYVADTGMVTLGPSQLLRVTVAPAADDGGIPTESISFNFDQLVYSRGACTGGVCMHSIQSRTTSAPITLAPGDTVSVDSSSSTTGTHRTIYYTAFRHGSASRSQKVQVNAQIIDTVTGAVVSFGGVQVAAADIGGDN